ncbi:LamG domain-containing protein [Halorubrum laminariae]|uniref:LamG domain-containing protein n=1 Tax=Halorubrum laminariae TaxID=1433523 RepID=A0ABD6BZ66_9EURY|nr:LamG domain-containing protein [Halorubrum laminariae]
MTDGSSRFTSDRRTHQEASWAGQADWEAGTTENVELVADDLVGQSPLQTGEISEGRVARWMMNDGSGPVTDEFSNFDLALSGASYSSSGYEGPHSLRFDRNGSEYAHTTTSDVWNDISANDSFTFIGWVYPFIDDQQFSALVMNAPPDGNQSIRFGINGGASGYDMHITLEDSSFNVGGNRYSTNTWEHFAVTYNGSTLTFYKGGADIGSETLNEPLPDYNENLYVGVWPGGGNPDWFDGKIDAMDIYSRELSSSEVSNHYDTGGVSG